MSNDTTSGMTVMRIALTHNVPTGTMKSTARSSEAFREAAMAIPQISAAARATRTRVVSFNGSYLLRKPAAPSIVSSGAAEAAARFATFAHARNRAAKAASNDTACHSEPAKHGEESPADRAH